MNQGQVNITSCNFTVEKTHPEGGTGFRSGCGYQ